MNHDKFFLTQHKIDLTCGYINQNFEPITSATVYSTPYQLNIYPIGEDVFAIKLTQGKETVTEGIFENLSENELQYHSNELFLGLRMNCSNINDKITLFLKAQIDDNPIENIVINYNPDKKIWGQIILSYRNTENKTTHLFTQEYENTLCPWNAGRRKILYQRILKRICHIILSQDTELIQIPVRYILHYLKSEGYDIDNRRFLYFLDEINRLIHQYNPAANEKTLFYKYRKTIDREEMFVIDYLAFESNYIKQVLRIHFNEDLSTLDQNRPDIARITTLKTTVVQSYQSYNRYSTKGQCNNGIIYHVYLEEKNARQSYKLVIKKEENNVIEVICDGIFNFKAAIPFTTSATEDDLTKLCAKKYNYYEIEPSENDSTINRIFLNNYPQKCSEIIEIIGVEKNGLIAHHLFPKMNYFTQHGSNLNLEISVKQLLIEFINKRELNKDEVIIYPIENFKQKVEKQFTLFLPHEHTLKNYVDQLNSLARLHGIIKSDEELISYVMNMDYSNFYSTPQTTLENLNLCLERLV